MLKKTITCKLKPTGEQAINLLATLQAFANACNQTLGIANRTGKKKAYDLHHASYYTVKAATGLTSNYVVRAIARVARSFGKKRPPTEFRPTSLDLDKDLFRFNPYNETVSLATIAGRQKVKLQLSNRQRHELRGQKPKAGQLSYDKKNRRFQIHFVIDVPEPARQAPQGVLGVDLGINRIATLSSGEIISGRSLNRLREIRQRARSSLQAKGTQGAKRALKRLRGKQARLQTDVNHCLSKQIVQQARQNNQAIALEDLTGIRQRADKGKRLRKMLGNWAFYQLRTFIEYKAKQAGVSVVFVDPKYTSKSCSSCGQSGSRHKHKFVCKSCGTSMDADLNGALNISRRGCQSVFSDSVTQPEAAVLVTDQQAVCFS